MKKNTKKAVMSLSLAAVLTLGGTLAYFTATTGDKTNIFTMGENITGVTEEPEWNEENAQKFVPGDIIAKDPQIKNTSNEDAVSAYVGMTVTYQVKGENDEWIDTTYAQLDKFINVKTATNVNTGTAEEIAVATTYLTTPFNNDTWTMAYDNTVAYYNSTLAPQETTKKLFTAIEIDPLALTPKQVASAEGTNVQFDVTKYQTVDSEGKTTYNYTTYTMKDFQIVVKGYMVQSDGFTDAQTALKTAFPEVFNK